MAEALASEGVPLGGICLYPVLGMPEWHIRGQWTRMGLWDVEAEQDKLRRTPFASGLEALTAAQRAKWLRGLVREQAYSLERTGEAPFPFLGRLAWYRTHAGGHGLRVFRSDRPYRLWVAAITCPTPDGTISHVSTAATLSLLVEQLIWNDPAKTVSAHGQARAGAPAMSSGTWRADVEALARVRTELEAMPVTQQSPQPAPAYPIPGGGR
jgi:hypothetical protein